MNSEKLWIAIGETDGAVVAAAENFPKRKPRSLHILLVAAIILSFSVTAFAVIKYRIGINNIWNNGEISESAASEIEKGTVQVGAEKTDEMYSAAVTEALSDGRNLYLTWQIESCGKPFPKGTRALIDLDFGGTTVNTDMGYVGGEIETGSENILAGYIVTDWNESMQNVPAALCISNIEAPEEILSGTEYAPDWAAIFEKCEYIDFPEIKYIHGCGDWPKEYFPQYGRLELKTEDSDCNVIDFACWEDGWLYLTVKNPKSAGTGAESKWIYALCDGETGKEIDFEHRLFAREGGTPATNYYVLAYRADLSTAENAVLKKRGGTVYKAVTEQNFRLDFSAGVTLSSTDLPCAVPGGRISCSALSMSISGVAAAENEAVEITDVTGNSVEIISYSFENILFETPQDPASIASIKINGKEILDANCAVKRGAN